MAPRLQWDAQGQGRRRQESKLPQPVKNALKKKEDTTFKVRHVFIPLDLYDPYRAFPKGAKWADVYVTEDGMTASQAIAGDEDIYAIRDQVVDIAAQFPAISANTILVDNPAGTARETKSFSDVRGLLDTAPYVETRAALKALDTTKETVSTLKEAGREGSFFFDSSNLSAKITADTLEIGFVAPTADPTGSTGAWRRNLKLSRLYRHRRKQARHCLERWDKGCNGQLKLGCRS